MRHGDAQGSARAATDAHAQARLAAGRAIMAVSRAEGARGIKPEHGLEGIERRLYYAGRPTLWWIKTEAALAEIERAFRGIRLIREETIANVLHAKSRLVVPELGPKCYLCITDIFSVRWKRTLSPQHCTVTPWSFSKKVDYADIWRYTHNCSPFPGPSMIGTESWDRVLR
jgi:hypothetical protein